MGSSTSGRQEIPDNLDEFQYHPACKRWPEMDAQRFEEHCHSIETYGQQIRILVWGYWILDGRSTFKACRKVDVAPLFEQFHPFSDDPDEIQKEIYGVVWARNGVRKETPLAKKIEIGQEWISRGMLPGDTPLARSTKANGEAPAPNKGELQEAVARQLGGSKRSYQRDEFVRKKGMPELQALVQADKIKLGMAEKVAKLPPDVQRFACARIGDGTAPAEAIAAARKDEYERTKPPVVDGNGNRVPEAYREIFDGRKDFSDLSREVAMILTKLELLARKPHGQCLREKDCLQRIMRSLKEGAAAIRGAAPHAVCVVCRGERKVKGDKCHGCEGKGWLIRLAVDGLPQELRREAV